jgi:hypothetical protein
MRTTRSSWALLTGAALAVATSICVVDRLGPRAIAPTRTAWPDARPSTPVQFRGNDGVAPVRREPRRPQFNPPLPDLTPMILYTSPAFRPVSR